MLTESDLQTPQWLATTVSGQCVIIRGHVGEHRLEGLRAILPLGAFQWAPIELPQGEALDPEFFASIMPAVPGEVPRKIYVMPLVASTAQVDALAEVRANQPYLQWVAVVPDPEIDPVLPDGILLFDSKTRAFVDEGKIPAAARAWAEKVLEGARSDEERRKVVAAEGPKILATVNAVLAGEYQALSSTLGKADASYITQLVGIASTIAGVEGIDADRVAGDVEESAAIGEILPPNTSPPPETRAPEVKTVQSRTSPPPRPQIFEDGKALPIYPPGDPAGRYSRELDAIRRDPEVHGALLEMLQEFQCEGEGGGKPPCADRCNDPAQKWACMRDHAWGIGMPAAIVDHWLEVFALMVARVGRNPREAYHSFTNVVLHASAANPTYSEVQFAGMVKQNGLPLQAPVSPVAPPAPAAPVTPAPAHPQSPLPPKPVGLPKITAFLPLPLKLQKSPAPAESRARHLIARLDALAGKMETLKSRFGALAGDPSTPPAANDPLPVPSAAGSWEADDPGDEDISLDALEKRAARFAHKKN